MKKQKKFKLLMVLVAAAALGAVAVTKFVHFGGGDSSDEEVGIAFVPLEPIFAPIYADRAFGGYVLLILNLELPDGRNLERVHEKMAPLRDAFLRDLYLQAALRRSSDPTIDIKRIKKRFLRLSEQILGPGVVSDILIESAVERRT